jgi:phage baseplate assembly protein W
MPSHEVTSADAWEINWAPATEAEEVLQNVRFIIGVAAASVPLARGLGLGAVGDAPMNQARAILMTDLVRSIQAFEPRATVREINFDPSDVLDGQLRPRVRIEI